MTFLLLIALPLILAFLIKFKILGYFFYLLPYLLRSLSRVRPTGENYRGKNIDISDIREAYDILGLPIDATENEVDQAYKELIRKNHPDLGGSEYLAKKINTAREYIINDRKSKGR